MLMMKQYPTDYIECEDDEFTEELVLNKYKATIHNYPNIDFVQVMRGYRPYIDYQNDYQNRVRMDDENKLTDLSNNGAKVKWRSVIWFPQSIPRHTFVLWMAVQERLMTQDKIAKWRMDEVLECTLCKQGYRTESMELMVTCKLFNVGVAFDDVHAAAGDLRPKGAVAAVVIAAHKTQGLCTNREYADDEAISYRLHRVRR
ncbi:RNA-directed DNA polymerase, eukaryota, Reverse transcriptase zinc-binding domain protein [Artemisia annua]|uniref:RNA-directed DNA polymerase, eukaryota, Reverse transcriptase zinc-binding domain protein n=1 Tax=Artemisia annua TaxID=35608 RepID=A0A2U1NH53_ARTAN|nr:RNA-directed DNA polymerase, eukaryota, Reverse transcriptase zinc-binding domain protein [Artemisia annua]